MEAAAIKYEEHTQVDKELFNQQVTKSKLERALLQLHHKQQQRKDLGDEIKALKEEVHDLFLEVESPIVVQSEDGTYICVQEKVVEKDVFDKGGLALELNMDKKEISKPWDYSFLTYKGKLTPKMIAKHTHSQSLKSVKISRTKRNPLEKANKKFKKK
ncbi:hypothetical protein P4679_27340 [Priestia megaterium]|uniref:hypothetical protein n=1 Tax=Priestia megaterium TaxID=1404 RepID=UPI002E1F0A5C|nr:hypothetical protein [Priestia megaterium]